MRTKPLIISLAIVAPSLLIAGQLKFDGISNQKHIRKDSINIEKVDGGSRNILIQSKEGDIDIFKVDGGSEKVRIIAQEDVRFGQKIDGGSKVYVEAKTGDISFAQKIDGGSEVTLKAPKGKITLVQKIDGGSTVKWCARSFNAGSQGVRGGSKVINICK